MIPLFYSLWYQTVQRINLIWGIVVSVGYNEIPMLSALLSAHPQMTTLGFSPNLNLEHESLTSNFSCLFRTQLYLKVIPLLALANYIDFNQLINVRQVNAAVINISGRQRMLSQRVALLALRLVCCVDSRSQEEVRRELLAMIDLMERSHLGLIQGDSEMKLPGKLSPTVQKMYYEAPLYLDQKVQEYLTAARTVAHSTSPTLTFDNPNLQHLLTASEKELLEALDIVVSQYQKEKEEQELEIDLYQAKLYSESCEATATAQEQSKQLQETIEELKNTQVQLIQAEKMSSLGQLVAGIAHEINNPLNFISGNLSHTEEYLQNIFELLDLYAQHYPQPVPEITQEIEDIELDYLTEDLIKILHSMKVGTQRLQDIVVSLRNFSRVDEEGMKKSDLHECLESTLLILQHRFRSNRTHSRIQITTDYSNLPLVECYPVQINQVFMNLISNAIDALESKENLETDFVPCIHIRSEVTPDNTVRVYIADNGMGIPEKIRQKIFESFFTTKPIGKGTGLGLSISSQIITEHHAGKLECISTPGEGTEFIVELPITQ